MLFTADDFKIKAENFDLTNGSNLLRIICGAFMFPHVAGKFAAGALAPATVGFLRQRGLQPGGSVGLYSGVR
jgi:putative oxidoreductase